MGVCEDRSHSCHDQPCIPHERIGETLFIEITCELISFAFQIANLKVVGVSTLVVVPRIRTTNYLDSLLGAIPSLASCKANEISVETLPDLKRIILVDDTNNAEEVRRMKDRMSCVVDFREAFLWEESVREREAVDKIQSKANCDDIINLQFTRLVSMLVATHVSNLFSSAGQREPPKLYLYVDGVLSLMTHLSHLLHLTCFVAYTHESSQ